MFCLNYVLFSDALKEVESLLYKNTLYKKEDFILATKKAIDTATDIINGKKLKNSLLKRGNHKLQKNVLMFDLPVGLTCNGICKNCYALKAERIYKNTRIMRLKNLILIEYAKRVEGFKNELLSYFKKELDQHFTFCKTKRLKPVCRFHSAGDIYCNEYKIMLLDIVTNNPKIKFYTYTKILCNSEIDYINKTYKNFNIVKSIIEVNNKKYINYGKKEDIKTLANKLKEDNQKVFICSYGGKNPKICCYNCFKCLNCSNVLFNQH